MLITLKLISLRSLTVLAGRLDLPDMIDLPGPFDLAALVDLPDFPNLANLLDLPGLSGLWGGASRPAAGNFRDKH